MWSFGTILFEILFRRKYAEVEDYYECEFPIFKIGLPFRLTCLFTPTYLLTQLSQQSTWRLIDPYV